MPFKADSDMVPPMGVAGEGYRFHITGLTHNESGYPVTSAKVQQDLVSRLVGKIESRKREIIEIEAFMMDDAEVGVIAYGSEGGSAKRAVKMAREKGIKAGMVRPKVLWPIDDDIFKELLGDLKRLIVVELNSGQLYSDARRWNSNTELICGYGGSLHTPQEILRAVEAE